MHPCERCVIDSLAGDSLAPVSFQPNLQRSSNQELRVSVAERMDPPRPDGSVDRDMDQRGAGRGRGRGPWSSAPHEVSALRRPRAGPGTQTTASGETKDTDQRKSEKPDQFTDIIQNSTLSVDAPVFVPKFTPRQSPQQQSSDRYAHKFSAQDRIQAAREIPLQTFQMQHSQGPGCNYDTPQHYQQGNHGQQGDNFSQQHRAKQNANTQNYRLFEEDTGGYNHNHMFEMFLEQDNYSYSTLANTKEKLMSVIHSLILNPGRFTSIVPSLINEISRHLKSPGDLQEIMKLIIQPSINEGNFRYSGARLCASLDAKIMSTMPTEQKLFRETLYTLCKAETESQSSSWKEKDDHTEEEQKKCHGLILFLAELVIQMELETAFGLGDLLIQLIVNILKKPAPNSVKNICQALKLAGHTLEKDKGDHRKEMMENMMRALTELVTAGRVDTHVGRMVQSVRQLRIGDWGHTPTADSTVENTETTEANESLNEPVFYGPDGKVLTPEENKFLEDVADCTTNFGDYLILDDRFDDEVWTSPEDDEIDAAYEEFLESIPNQIKNQISE
ncbi:polyadenylate-binding protein-interacting protein 1 [Lasioglossum baleicum]|uniref:polyadenylate-binding protein-interacting protein 1 n=1 Tax=Lasioglossum baleicum TaxID=434251 RepID=UPI003FCD8092